MADLKVTYFEKHSTTVLLLGLALIIFAPIIFTLPSFSNYFDFSRTGQIGDTIGGITAPIVNFLGAVLVYISFKSQQRANQQQWKAINIESQIKYFEATIEKLDSLKYDLNTINHEKNYFKHIRVQVKEYSPDLQSFIDEFSFLNKLIMFARYFNVYFERLSSSILTDELKEHYRSALFLESLDLHQRLIALNDSFIEASTIEIKNPASIKIKRDMSRLRIEIEKTENILNILRNEFHFKETRD